MRNPLFALKRHVRWFWQRRTRGFDDRELWSLDCTISRFIAPRLRALAKMSHGHPSDMTADQWVAMLNRMADSFELTSEYHVTGEPEDEAFECLGLFRDYFFYLWD